VLVGDAPAIAKARRARKIYGGGMRQAGIVAAAGLYALEHNLARLADDHRRARTLALRLAEVPGLSVDMSRVQTNMIFVGTKGTGLPAAELVSRARRHGLLALDEATWSMRLVTHLDVDDAGVDAAVVAVRRAVAATPDDDVRSHGRG
jgi:threonine aldolase